MHVLLDVSRLIGCSRRRTPSGIDRVEAAYVRHWLGRPAADVTFVARSPLRGFSVVPRPMVADLYARHGFVRTGEEKGATRWAADPATLTPPGTRIHLLRE